MKVCEADEWSLRVRDFCLGIYRDNEGTYGIVARYPEGNGEINVFQPVIFGKGV